MSYARWTIEDAQAWVADCLHWRKHVLHGDKIHWCVEWDGLPVDETTDEFWCCRCFGPTEGSAK